MQATRERPSKQDQAAGVVHAQHNGNFARSHSAHMEDIREITRKGEGAKILAVQELTQKVKLDGYTVIQTDKPGHCGEALLVHDSLKVRRANVRDAARSNRGEAIGDRGFPWAVVDLPGWGDTLEICVHMPPLRMFDTLYPVFGASLNARIRVAKVPFVAMGDFNKLIRADPANLHGSFDAQWIGARIDLMAFSPKLDGQLTWWEQPHPARPDNHPTVFALPSKTVR